jgi:hypothetical protein
MTEQPLAFTIFGVPRSGTAALARGANRHPRVFCLHEWQIGTRDGVPTPRFPAILHNPAGFQISQRLGDTEAATLARKAGRWPSLVYGNKNPEYFLGFHQLLRVAPEARHSAICRCPYDVAPSWDARASAPSDVSWPAGKIGLFSVIDWLLMLDCIALYGSAIRVLSFDAAYFGQPDTFVAWLEWVAGFPVPQYVRDAFASLIMNTLPEARGKPAQGPAARVLDRIGARDAHDVIVAARWAPGTALAADLRAYVDRVAEQAAELVATSLRNGGGGARLGPHMGGRAARPLRRPPRAQPRHDGRAGDAGRRPRRRTAH